MPYPRHPAVRRALEPFAPLQPDFGVRNILSRRSGQFRGRIACPKAPEAHTEATLEPLFALRASASPQIQQFVMQPMRVREILKDVTIKGYTPDAAAYVLNGQLALVEVKPHDVLAQADVLTRLLAFRHRLECAGFKLLFSTNRELDRPEENDRIRIVKGHLKVFEPRMTIALDRGLAGVRRLPLGEAAEALGSRTAALHLVANGRFFIDYTRPLNEAALLTRSPEEFCHALKLFSSW